jgi:hypothetical protein
MQAQEVVLMEVVTFCGYKDAEVGLLLTVGCKSLVLGNLVLVAGGNLGSSAAPTLRAMALWGRVGLMMAHKSQIVVRGLSCWQICWDHGVRNGEM